MSKLANDGETTKRDNQTMKTIGILIILTMFIGGCGVLYPQNTNYPIGRPTAEEQAEALADIQRMYTVIKTKSKPNETVSLTGIDLLLMGWSWRHEHGYAITEGQVKNISSQSLDNIEAIVEFYTKDGKFITSDSSLIEYRPLLSGQTSPFKVYATWNPAMKSAKIDFKFLFGGSIPWKKAK